MKEVSPQRRGDAEKIKDLAEIYRNFSKFACYNKKNSASPRLCGKKIVTDNLSELFRTVLAENMALEFAESHLTCRVR